MKEIAGISLLALVLSGCAGVTFRSEGVQDLPNDFKSRTPIDNTASYRFHLDQNIGAIIVPDPANPGQYKFTGRTILPPSFTPNEEQLDRTANSVYSSKVTFGVGGSVAIAQLFSLTINSDTSKELTIIDIARSDVPTDIIQGALPALLKEKTAKGSAKEYWVKSLLLSQIVVKTYTSESTKASGSGPAYGATVNGNASVYDTDDVASQDYFLGADLIDLDDITVSREGSSVRLDSVPPAHVGHIQLEK